jgi:hypothetical protein
MKGMTFQGVAKDISLSKEDTKKGRTYTPLLKSVQRCAIDKRRKVKTGWKLSVQILAREVKPESQSCQEEDSSSQLNLLGFGIHGTAYFHLHI